MPFRHATLKKHDKALFVLATLLPVLVLCFVFYFSYNFYQNGLREIRLAQNIGEIRRLDEVLTMSSRLAAASGRDSYAERYDVHVAALDSTIKETFALYDSEALQETVRMTDLANGELVRMEERAFYLAANGQNGEAFDLLHSDEYSLQKSLYSRGMHNATVIMQDSAVKRRSHLQNMVLGSLVLLILSLLTLGKVYSRMQREHREVLARQERYRATQRLVSSSMDVMNNFLNNMVYFRVKAEKSGGFDEEELALLDDALDEAKKKFHSLAVAEAKARDLGGIEVMAGEQQQRIGVCSLQ